MLKPRKKKRTPKRVLALPDLEQSKAAVLNSLASQSGQRTYDRAATDFVDWYCSEPRLADSRRRTHARPVRLEEAGCRVLAGEQRLHFTAKRLIGTARFIKNFVVRGVK